MWWYLETALSEAIRSGGWRPPDGTSALRGETKERPLLLSLWGDSQKVPVCKSEKEPSPEPDHAGTMIWNCPELWGMNVCCLAPHLQYFAVVAELMKTVLMRPGLWQEFLSSCSRERFGHLILLYRKCGHESLTTFCIECQKLRFVIVL